MPVGSERSVLERTSREVDKLVPVALDRIEHECLGGGMMIWVNVWV